MGEWSAGKPEFEKVSIPVWGNHDYAGLNEVHIPFNMSTICNVRPLKKISWKKAFVPLYTYTNMLSYWRWIHKLDTQQCQCDSIWLSWLVVNSGWAADKHCHCDLIFIMNILQQYHGARHAWSIICSVNWGYMCSPGKNPQFWFKMLFVTEKTRVSSLLFAPYIDSSESEPAVTWAGAGPEDALTTRPGSGSAT